MTTTCKHGQLARSCELCEKDAENERLREELAASKAREEAYRAEVVKLSGQLAKAQKAQEPAAWPMEEQPDGSLIPVDPSEIAAPQSAEVDQLRVALEKARTAFSCIDATNASDDVLHIVSKEIAAIDAVLGKKP
jgi:hypothetical protein